MLYTPSPLKKTTTHFLTNTLPIFQGKKRRFNACTFEDLKLPSHVPVYLMQEENVRQCWLGLPQIYP